jgi:sugar (pentulose or hexulose) kinase
MFLGIDLGTSGVKVLLMDGAQNVVGTATRRLTVAGGDHRDAGGDGGAGRRT